MPTYEYACDACEHAFEEFQSITAAPLKKCPRCGKAKLKRLIGTGGGVIFKGSGFYTTDYRSDSYKKAAEAAKTSESGKTAESKPTEVKPADSGGSKSETKPESAKPAAPAGKTETPAAPTAPATTSDKSKGKSRQGK